MAITERSVITNRRDKSKMDSRFRGNYDRTKSGKKEVEPAPRNFAELKQAGIEQDGKLSRRVRRSNQ